MNCYLDFEFTGLHQKTTPISIGLVADDGKTFYAEFTDYDKSQCDDLIKENVINNLRLQQYVCEPGVNFEIGVKIKSISDGGGFIFEDTYEVIGDNKIISLRLQKWLLQYEKVQIVGDVMSYDWVLFCELFGGAFNIPKNVYYIPVDISTMFVCNGIDPDINREIYAFGVLAAPDEQKHNSLWDAKVIRDCYKKLTMLKNEKPETNK